MQEIKVIDQSRQAFMYAERQSNDDENYSDDASVQITSDSGSSEAEIWARGVQSPMDERGKLLIKKRRASIRLKSMRQIKKRLAEERLMKRRRSKKVGKIISECPGIGEEIEDFVKQCGAGADAWRRAGIMTFDGNRKIKKKATFKRIKEHVEAKYEWNISYGSVVQHWSSSFYAALDKIQYKNGRNIVNIGRDDQAGFLLDTMATHKQHATLCVKGDEHITTRTDMSTNTLPIFMLPSTTFQVPKQLAKSVQEL